MRDLLRIRDFRLLWTGQAISNTGDAVTSLAVLLTAQRLTGSTAAVAGTAIAIALPTLLFGMVAGAYVDRWNRKTVMIVSDLIRSGFVLALLLVTTADRMWMLYTIAFIQAALGTFFNPARSAFLPRVVPQDHLLSANSLGQMTQVVMGLAGTAIAGVIAGVFDTMAPAYILDSGSFLFSTAALLLIRADGTPQSAPEADRRILADVRTGLATVGNSRVLLGVMMGAAIAMFGLGAVNVLLVPFIVEVLSVPETWFAAIEASQVIPMVLAAGLVAALAKKLKPTAIISWALGGVGIAVAAMSLADAPWHLMACMFAIGWMMTPLQASASTLIQTEVSDEVRGRTGAALSTVITGASVASMALAGATAAAVGVRGVFVIAGVFGLVSAIATALLFRGVTLRSPEPSPEATPA